MGSGLGLRGTEQSPQDPLVFWVPGQWGFFGTCQGTKREYYSYLFNIENLFLRARSAFNGFAGTSASSFGVLEYWSVGVLAENENPNLM